MSSFIQLNKHLPRSKSNLHCPETYSIRGDQIFPFLLDMDLQTIKNGVKPSEVVAALKTSTEERLEKLRSPLRKYRVGTKKDAFSRCPEAIIFQNFKTGVTYSTTLTVTNQRTVPQNLNMYFEKSRFFTLSMDTDHCNLTKIAPGMSNVFKISFLPTDAYRDYVHEVHFVSGDNCFSVPIFALGPRPITYIPDKIILPPTLVKVESSHTIVLKNNGQMPLNYSAVVPEPFSCNIPKAIVPPNGILEIKYSCYPLKPGYTCGKVEFYFRNAFCIAVEIECDVKNVKVDIDSHYVTFEDVYMGLTSKKALVLHNTSEYPLNFAWKINDEEEEKHKITKLVDLMTRMKEYEQKRYEKLEYMDIVDGDSHKNIYERIFKDEQGDLFARQTFLYMSNFFQVIPKVGKVLPKSDFECSVVFAPRQNILYHSSAYLDIEGTERRLRVSLQGCGIGPPVMFSVNNLNAGQIFLTAKHQYELAVINKGVIAATVTYQPKKTDWGGILSCVPETLLLGPDCTKAFIVVFYSELQGEFIETLDFKVEESEDHLQCIFSGNVICPLLKCVPEEVDFGTVSVGISNTRQIYLINDSRVSIRFDFEFEDDFAAKGQEYIEIVPRHGKVYEYSGVKIKITFCCDTSSLWKTNLLLVMWNSRMYTIKIPFSCLCSSPRIICDPEVISIKFCFLDCDYIRTIKLTNKTDLPGYVQYVQNTDVEDESLVCVPSKTNLYFNGFECLSLELNIKVSSLGPHKLPLQFSVIGGSLQTLCTINCTGQGPVVSYSPDEVDFGKIDVLRRYSQKLTLINDSPILAKIRAYCKSSHSFFIEESDSELELKPEEQTDVTIWAQFNNPGICKDTVYVEIFQGDVNTIKVFGDGEGTSILTEPFVAPTLNLGTILTYKPFTKEIKITNKGSFRHKILFTKQPSIRILKESEEDKIPSIFTIIPRYLELDANQSATVTLKCSSKKPRVVTEDYYCHALIGKSVHIQTIISFMIEAEFVDPNLSFSESDVNFNLAIVGNVAEGKTEDVIHVTNMTGIPLQVQITVEDNFENFTVDQHGEKFTKVCHELERNSILGVHFNPAIKEKRRHFQEARLIFEYKNHPKTDIINLHGEVMFPTIKLIPSEFEFRCVPLGSTAYKNIVMKNVSALMVKFKWFWLEQSVQINQIERAKDGTKSFQMAESTFLSNNFMDYVDPKLNEQEDTEDRSPKPSLGDSDRFMPASSDIPKYLYDSNRYLAEMKSLLSAVTSLCKPQKGDQLGANSVSQSSGKRITKLFSLEPSEGVLKPNEYSIVTVGFNPSPNTEVTAVAVCQIEGGEEETLFVKGKSSRLSYKLDKSSVNYGNQVFCEMCTNHLTLTNNGLCSIDFKVIVEESVSMQAEMINVQPKDGNLTPGASVTFKIDYFPGFPGYFSKNILLELGYLEPVTVNIHGYAVLNQVFLHVPRPDMELDPIDCYKAIGWITPDYLEALQTTGSPEINDEPEDPLNFLEKNDWVYVSYNDLYPSIMDISLAMERIAAFNHVTKNPKLLKEHTVAKKIPYIPQFYAAPYCVDFGYVVRDIPVCYTVMMYNYGPIACDVKLLENNKTALLEKEIKIEFKNKVLVHGESTELYVIFAPTKRKCVQLNKKIEDVFRLTVRHGPIISVQVKAEVTLPVVSLEHEELHFDKVYCGDVLRKTIILTNNGYVKSKWSATISKPTRKGEVAGFFIIPKEGVLDAGRKTYLDIYFLPANTRKIKRTLCIDIESNAQPIFMDLYGEGLESTLMIVPAELKFSPTLSYFEHTLHFAVQNLAEIPMEFYFSSMDSESELEKQLIQVYLKYKNLKHVFIPLRIAGSGLPEFFSDTYNNLIDKLRSKMISRDSKEMENMEESQEVNSSKSMRKSSELEDPLAKYSSTELNSLLMEYITAEGFDDDLGTHTTYHMDETADNIEIIEPTPRLSAVEVERKSILFIFHGAPTTDYYKAANQVGIALSVPVYSIDRLIIESLVEETHTIASDIKEHIENAFSNLLDPKTDGQVRENIELESSEYDKILDKIEIILTKKPKKGGKKSAPKEKGSKASSEKSQGKGKDKPTAAGDCFLNISSDSIVDLLRPKMKYFSHLVIESLNSTFIPQKNTALYTLLKAAGSIQYINFIIFSSTIADFIKNEEMKLQTNVVEIKDDKAEVAKSSPKTKAGSEKRTKGSTKAGSEKASKKSRSPGKGGDMTKKILQRLSKALKAQLEEFENLRLEMLHIVQNWDKKSLSLRKPYSGATGTKKDPGTKDSARTLKTSVKKQTSNINLDEASFEQGIYLWLILNSSNEREVDFSEMLRNCMKEDHEFQIIFEEIEESKKEKFEESQTSFSVVSKPGNQKNEQSSVFTIKNYQGKENFYPVKSRSKSGSSIKARRKRSSRGSRKSADSRVSTEVILTLTKNETDVEFSPKTILYPGDLIRYQVTFCPRKCGVYKYTYTLETTRDKVPYQIVCDAVCEFPELNLTPEFMFPKTLENYREKASYDHFVFIKDQKIFDFGSIIAGINPEKCLVYSTAILLRNDSSSDCNVTVTLSNDIFSMEPSSFIVTPKSEDILNLSVKSTKIGTVTAQLFISIKNNPKVEEFTLACSPCKLEFSISPKTINFDKVPLNYTAKRIVKLTNTSPICLRWEFVDSEWASDIFSLSEGSGNVDLYSVSDIVFKFCPMEEISFPKRYLPIKVFDVNSSSSEPCYTENITIHADSVEYDLDVEGHIDYGQIKGGIDHKRNLAITNKGKCEVILKIELINNPLEGHNFVREYFKVQPLLLVLGAQKTENLSISFHPKNSLAVSNLLLFVVSMVESLQSGHVVKSYQVTTSATAFMPSYKLCPQSHLNFGYVPLTGAKKLKMELTNKGRFPFSFTILNYAKILEASKKGKKGTGPEKKSKKSAKSDKASSKSGKASSKSDKASSKGDEKKSKSGKKGKSDKGTKSKSGTSKTSKGTKKSDKKKITKITKLDVGRFTIIPSSGIVEPTKKCEIEIEITPNEIKNYREDILVNIAEIEDMQKKKVIALKAIGCESIINLRDFDSVFMEQYVVPSIDDFIMPRNVDGCCVFSSSETTLYFKLICINTTFTTRLHFKNVGYVTSHLTAKLDDFGRNVFSVTPPTKVLEPHSSCFLEVTFSPRSLEKVTGTLEISYNASTDNKLIVQLYGQACLPQIKLLKPLTETNEAVLNFGPVCVGFVKKERITFKNIGQIKCKVIVEISECDDMLTIVPVDTTFKKLNVQDKDCIDDMKRNVTVNLLLDEVAEFDLIYKPVKEERIQSFLTIHTIRNPYEISKIEINTESFDNAIIIEEMEPIVISAQHSSISDISVKNSIGYLLDLGYKQLNKLYKKSFFIRNRSNKDTYKFKFYCSQVLFIPEIGHLKPNAYKEILVIFKATSPVVSKMEGISCTINKIEYVSPDSNPLSWDDRQKFVYWIVDDDGSSSGNSEISSGVKSSIASVGKSLNSNTGVKLSETENMAAKRTKVIAEGTEPEILTDPDSLEIIPLYLTVSADYCRYDCETRFIEFEDTYIKEESIREFEVENNGTVPVSIAWTLRDKNPCCLRRSNSEVHLNRGTSLLGTSLKSASSSSLVSSSHSSEAEAALPMAVNPEKAVIEPGQTGTFKLLFYPQEESSFEAVLESSIESLDPNLEEMRIEVSAVALPVPFYFEMEDRSSTNKDISLDFENIGLATESTRKVMLVNPSDEQVSFEIVAKHKKEFSYFVCDISKGTISRKKKFATSFSFCPPIIGTFQELYILKIPENDVQRNILLEGVCREPRIYFTETNTVLKPTVPKVKTTKSLKLKNDEAFPISFKFIKKSLYSESQQDKLEVYPIVGKLKPQSETDIKITFTTLNIVSTSFHVKCLIEKLRSPLSLHVSAQCIKVQPVVSYTNRNGEVILLNEDKVNLVDLGYTYKGRKDAIKFEISNQGQTGIFYTWEFDPKPVAHLFKIYLETEKNFIKINETDVVTLFLESIRTGVLKQFKINLTIMYGPIYIIHINAISDKPSFSFSFNSYNFGYCLTQKGETNYYNTILCFKNLDSKKILVENLFEKTDYLAVNFLSSNVLPGETRNIPMKFYPQTVGIYKSEVLFSLGGNKYTIPITGEAVNLNLELCNPRDKFIKFEGVLVQTVKKYRVVVCNNSLAKVNVHFDLFDDLTIQKKKTEKMQKGTMKMPVLPPPPKESKKKDKGGKKEANKKENKSKDSKSKSDKKSDKTKSKKEEEKQAQDRLAAELLLKKQAEERQKYLESFAIVPSMFIDIPPRGKGYFDVIFQPKKQMEFEERIYFETQDYVEPFCVIKGSSIISEFSLDKKELLFPGVITGCNSSKIITLKNTGDVTGSFSWKIEDKRNIFNIEPKQGFVLPKNDMKIKITFLPKFEKCEFRVKAMCSIKEFKETLQLVLKGNSVKMPEPTATVNLKCNVREKVIDNSVIVTNNTSEQWLLQTEIAHEAFSTPKEVIALPFSAASIVITYFPKRMTAGKPNEAKLFIKIPDGSGLVYNLIGNAGPPAIRGKIEKEIRCKQNYYELVPIENWLTIKQTFKVTTELISPITIKTLYKIFGPKTIELTGMEAKKYKWGIYVVNEGPMEFRVTFKNLQTGEYEVFEIGLKVLPSEPIETVIFDTRVRESVTKHITLENPVDIPVTYLLETSEKNFILAKSVKMEPYTTAKVDITYTPLQTESLSTNINAKCEELGTYTYLIKLNASPPRTEECIVVTSELGTKAAKNITFKNVFDRAIDFSYKFDNEQFYMERCNSIPAGDSSKITIAFEPSKLGHSKGKLFLTSSVAGEYVYPLDGEGMSPTPKGPFNVRLNIPTTIEFKNPFSEDKQFTFHIQPDTFQCDFNEDIIGARKIARFLIYVRPPSESSSCPVTGKLVIYSTDEPQIQWKYYLQFIR